MMIPLKQYAIPFKGLRIGKHHYQFEVDDRFFAAFEGSEIRKGEARVAVELDRGEAMLEVQTSLRGNATVDCDRCLEPCTLPLSFDGRLTVRFSEEADDYDGDILWITPAETELNLAQYIYESIVLSLPSRRVHANGPDGKPGCNPEMLKRFRTMTPESFDRMADRAEKRLGNNPEFEKLQQLKVTMNNHKKTK